ncbi:MAG: RluA family pseudouridine synthase [Thermodesulfobacteriota bacterium]|nr:RluA family pseudouridine synthase [Thermodesulfobacteriota bacterium]
MDGKLEKTLFYSGPDEGKQVRLDVFVSCSSIGLSRSRIQALIKSGDIKLNNCLSRPSNKLKPGDKITISIPPPSTSILKAESVDFNIIHEDNALIVLNKPAGLVVHPAPGHDAGTLVHGLLQHCQDLSGIGGILRPGIVHRLDKDTSGLMVVAKNDHAHTFLSKQFKNGVVKKQYIALVHGQLKRDRGTIDLPVARHSTKRKQMSVALSAGRRALTFWEKIQEFDSGFSLLSVSLKTGRTHQIRVHLSYIGHPVVADTVYGYGRKWWKKHALRQTGMLPYIERQMLHSRRLGFIHPDQERYLEFEAPLPDDMEQMVHALKLLDLQV